MRPDRLRLYRTMLTSRRLEEEIARLWHDGLVSGEMHLGIGEEGIVAGVLDHLGDGDAVAADHRSTPPMVMRGVNLAALVAECLAATVLEAGIAARYARVCVEDYDPVRPPPRGARAAQRRADPRRGITAPGGCRPVVRERERERGPSLAARLRRSLRAGSTEAGAEADRAGRQILSPRS